MIYSIALGLLLAVATTAVQAVGTTTLIGFLKSQQHDFLSTWGELKTLSITAVSLLLILIVEIIIWAVAYKFIVGGDRFPDWESAAYFSTVTFTTLGYGDIVIDGRWRMLSACQAMTGLLVFGWSTALLFAVVQRIWQQKLGDPEPDK